VCDASDNFQQDRLLSSLTLSIWSLCVSRARSSCAGELSSPISLIHNYKAMIESKTFSDNTGTPSQERTSASSLSRMYFSHTPSVRRQCRDSLASRLCNREPDNQKHTCSALSSFSPGCRKKVDGPVRRCVGSEVTTAHVKERGERKKEKRERENERENGRERERERERENERERERYTHTHTHTQEHRVQ
jgi:hypothetical protein